MRRAKVDPALEVRVLGSRALRYDQPSDPRDDRPDHVRAASGLAIYGGRLVVVQDDASFLAVVASDGVSAIKLPRGLDGRRRFEVAIGNKLDKLDLESCIAIDDELWAFGSGSLPIREKICRVQHATPRVVDAERARSTHACGRRSRAGSTSKASRGNAINSCCSTAATRVARISVRRSSGSRSRRCARGSMAARSSP